MMLKFSIKEKFPIETGLRVPYWDVFISYKSDNVEIARQVADYLIAAGKKVWFAEYQVLIKHYNEFGKLLNYGFSHSHRVIAFTNDSYIKSQYCRVELEHFLARNDPSCILEIKCPREDLPHQEYPALECSPSYEGSTVEGILSFIQHETGWPIPAPIVPRCESGVEPYETACLNRPVTLNTAGWGLKTEGKLDGKGSIRGLSFEYGDTPLVVNLYCGLETSHPGRRRGYAPQRELDEDLYHYLMDFARIYSSRMHTRIRGLHLVHYGGISQIALTRWVYCCWSRKYSIIVRNQITGQVAEFVYTFGFWGSFLDYCRYAHIMDQFVLSMQWS